MYIHMHVQSPHSQNKPFWWETRTIECCVCFVCNGRSSNSRSRNESCRTDHLGNDKCSHCRYLRRVTHVCPDANSAWERMLKQKVGYPHGWVPGLATFTIASMQMATWNAGLPVEECAALKEPRPQDSNGPHCHKSLTTVWSISGKGYLWRKHDWEGKGKQETKAQDEKATTWRIWRRGSSSHTLTMKQSLRMNDLRWCQPLLGDLTIFKRLLKTIHICLFLKIRCHHFSVLTQLFAYLRCMLPMPGATQPVI